MKARKLKGFTLIEMAVVLFIVSLLILLIMPNIATHRDRASSINKSALQTEVNTQAALYADHKGKDINKVSLAELKRAKYLTDKQVKAANKHGIKPGASQWRTAGLR